MDVPLEIAARIEQELRRLDPTARILTPAPEPDVRVVNDWGYIYGSITTAGKQHVTSSNSRVKDGHGEPLSRRWEFDPRDDLAFTAAVQAAYDSLRPARR